MRTMTYDMKQILSEAKRLAFTIPRFQREFVWKPVQIKLLIDSLARNFPIGSLLLLVENDPKKPFLASRSIQALIEENERSDVESAERDEPVNRFYVLDGQQRLTSIIQVFLQASTSVTYYFDLRKVNKFDELDNQTDWIVVKKPNQRIHPWLLRSESIIDRQKCQVRVEEYFETEEQELRGNRQAQREASARVNNVFETIRNYQVPLVVIDRTESTEAICRIFETINSTGTRLTTFDLAVARFYPEPDLHALWEQSQSRHSILRTYEVDGERALQVITLTESTQKSEAAYPEATRSALLGLPHQVIIDRWEKATDDLAQAYKWAEEHGAAPRMVPNEALMVPLAVFLARLSDRWKRSQPGYASALDRWYLASCLQQGSRQATNYRISLTTSLLLKWLNYGTVPSPADVVLNVDTLLSLKPTDARYKAILAFIRWRMGNDFWTGDSLSGTQLEDHHIFPVVCAKRDEVSRTLLDSIGNRLLVTKNTNQIISDRLPRDYFREIHKTASQQKTLPRQMETLEKACIMLPSDEAGIEKCMDVKNAEHFIRDRAARILEAIRSVLGDALKSASTDDDEE